MNNKTAHEKMKKVATATKTATKATTTTAKKIEYTNHLSNDFWAESDSDWTESNSKFEFLSKYEESLSQEKKKQKVL